MKIFVSMRFADNVLYKEKRDGISNDYIELFDYFNITPILIPNALKDPKKYFSQIKASGVFLTGGDDPRINNSRTNTEKLLIKYAIQKKLPIFGVCRGLQILNIYFDGAVKAFKNQANQNKEHKIMINNNFCNLLNGEEFTVNNYHNYYISDESLGKNLIPFAVSDHKTIEGFFHNKLKITAIQWHPERNSIIESIDIELIKNWIVQCT